MCVSLTFWRISNSYMFCNCAAVGDGARFYCDGGRFFVYSFLHRRRSTRFARNNDILPEVYLYRPPTSSAESVRFHSALVVHSKNWIYSSLDAVCTERTSAPAVIGNHDARAVGTTVTALATHLCAPTPLPLRTVVGKVPVYVAHVVRLKP